MRREKFICQIPEQYVVDNQKWVEILPHIHNEQIVGFYLNIYEDLNSDSLYDSWFNKIEYAQEAARENFGIQMSDWEGILY